MTLSAIYLSAGGSGEDALLTVVVVACSEVNAVFSSLKCFWFEDGDGPDGVPCQAHPSLMVNTSVDLLEADGLHGGICPSPHSDVS